MSVFGNPLKIGGSGGGGGLTLPAIVAAIHARNTGTSWTAIGSSSSVWANKGVNTDVVTEYNGTLTFTESGTYTVYIAARGGNTTSGAARYAHYQLLLNSYVEMVDTTNDLDNQGGTASISLNIAANDQLVLNVKASSGSGTTITASIIVVKTA